MSVGEVVSMKIISDRFGVPVLQEEDGTVVNIAWSEQDNLAAMEMMEPGLVDQLRNRIKTAVSQYIPLDDSLSYDEWMTQFTEAQTINEFGTALHVLAQVKMRAQDLAGQYELEVPHDHTG